MKPAALLAFITDIHALGLETAQGLYLTAGWCWDLHDKSRAFAKRFLDKTGAMPTYNQAAYYSATMTYLNAVKAVGATDADKVMDQLRKMKVDDMYTSERIIRPDGLLRNGRSIHLYARRSASLRISRPALRHELAADSRQLGLQGIRQDLEFAKIWRSESAEEMQQADLLVARILFLDGQPNMQSLDQLRIGRDIRKTSSAI